MSERDLPRRGVAVCRAADALHRRTLFVPPHGARATASFSELASCVVVNYTTVCEIRAVPAERHPPPARLLSSPRVTSIRLGAERWGPMRTRAPAEPDLLL
eukprot:6188142-Pleurochrysis_carterae.AAC.1